MVCSMLTASGGMQWRAVISFRCFKDLDPDSAGLIRRGLVCCSHKGKDNEGFESMIHYCACTGGSASVHCGYFSPPKSSFGRPSNQGPTSSCKTCGGKILIDGKGANPENMLSAVGLKFPRVIDPDLNWITDSKAPKGNKRGMRRARSALIGSLKKQGITLSLTEGDGDQIDKGLKREADMPVSESEKLGVSILGRRFSDMVESVPIKKRRIPLVRSPSSPPRALSPCPGESQRLLQNLFASDVKELEISSDDKPQVPINTSTTSRSSHVGSPKEVADGRINVQEKTKKLVDNVDFSGISILAAAACNSNMGGSVINAEGLVVEDNSFTANTKLGTLDIQENAGSVSLQEEANEKHIRITNNSETHLSNGKSDVRNSANASISMETGIASQNKLGMRFGDDVDKNEIVSDSPSPDKSMNLSRDCPNKENGALERVDSMCVRDDRSHWDLNTVMDAWGTSDDPVMDAWETPDIPIEGPQQHAVLDTCVGGVDNEKPANFDCCLGSKVLENGHEGGCRLTDSPTSSDRPFCSKICLDMQLDPEPMVQNSDIGTPAPTLLIKTMLQAFDPEMQIHKRPGYLIDDAVEDCVPNKNENVCLLDLGIREYCAGEKHTLDTCKGSDNGRNNTMDVLEETKLLDNLVNISCDAETAMSSPMKHAVEPAENCSVVSNCDVMEEKPAEKCVIASLTEEENGKMPILSGNSIDPSAHQTRNVCGPHHQAVHVTNNTVEIDRPVSEDIRDADPTFEGSDDANHPMLLDAGNDDLGYHHAIGEEEGQHMGQLSACSRSPGHEKHPVLQNDFGKDSGKVDDCQSVGHNADPVNVDGMTCQLLQAEHMDKAASSFVSQTKTVKGMTYGSDGDSAFIPNVLSNCEGSSCVGKGDETVVADLEVQEAEGFAVANENLHTGEMIISKDGDCKVSIGTPIDKLLGMGSTQSVAAGLSPHSEASKSYMDERANSCNEVALEEDPDDSNCESDVSQKDQIPATDMEKENELPADEDSQYEDGEFRESVVHSWGEEVGGEEHLDYGYSDNNRDTDDFGAGGDDPISTSSQVERTRCEADVPSEAGHVDGEDERVGMEMDEQEANSQLCPQGSSKTDALDTKFVKNRPVKAVKRISKGLFGRRDCIEKLKKDSEAVQELGESKESFMVDNNQAGVEGAGPRDSSHTTSSRIKSSGWDRLPEGGDNSGAAVNKIADGSAKKVDSGVGLDGFSSTGESLKRVVGSMAGRDAPSRIEGPKSSDESLRKDKLYAPGRRSGEDGDSNLGMQKDVGRGKSSGRGGSSVHMHGRGRGGDQWLDSSGGHWCPNRHHSPGYYGPPVFGVLGPKNAAAVAAAKVESSGFVVAPDGTIVRAAGTGNVGRVGRQPIDASSQSVHRTFIRRGSPINREGAMGYGVQVGLGPRREMSPFDRRIGVGRDGSGGYGPGMVGPIHRERYRGPLPDDRVESSLPMERPLPRRERSFSPTIHRRASPLHPSRSHTKSPSRSRTRSPHLWTSPRGRSACGIDGGHGLRRRCRSPLAIRSKARLERIRSPRRHGFPEHMVSLVSSSRNHGSPPHPSRWVDDRRDLDHFRDHEYKRSSVSERSPPGRVFSRSRRYDAMDSPVRLKHEEYYRPMHSARFPEFARDSRGPRYDGSDDDRRKHGDRYAITHSVRPYNIEGDVKRFRYDVEDGFRSHDPRTKNVSDFHGSVNPRDYDRDVDSRFETGPRRAKSRGEEEKGHFRYERDGKHSSSFKSFGVREGDDDVAPRRRRPS